MALAGRGLSHVAFGLARYVDVDVLGRDIAAQGLVELTGPGLDVAAAQLGVTARTAARYLGLVGGGPDHPIRSRTKLLANLEHMLGVDGRFVGLIRTARRRAGGSRDDVLLGWRNAATCVRGHLRPDGYGIYRHHGQLHSFFREYDRGTMRPEGDRKKLRAHRRYRASDADRRDDDGFPTILVVATESATEERIARAVRVVESGGDAPRPILLTDRRRIDHAGNPGGFLGRIWRRPLARFDDERALWPTDLGSAFGSSIRLRSSGLPTLWSNNTSNTTFVSVRQHRSVDTLQTSSRCGPAGSERPASARAQGGGSGVPARRRRGCSARVSRPRPTPSTRRSR
jgi:hypothetical protein